MIKNSDIATILREMAALYDIRGEKYKSQAYEKAVLGVERSDQELADVYRRAGLKGLLGIPGVGKNIAQHIEELIRTGKLGKYEQMKKQLPADIASLVQVPGVGPRTVKILHEKLGIKTVKDLEQAAKAGKISALPDFGREKELKILKGIRLLAAGSGRYLLGYVYPLAQRLLKTLKNSRRFDRITIAGSLRRMQETVGDIDMVGLAESPSEAMDFFVSIPEAEEILEHGKTRSEIRLKNGLQVDLRIVPKQSYGAALQYFTGNRSHTLKLRNIAIKKGYKLNEYGVFRGEKQIAGTTEEDVYKALGLEWMPPELREDQGEIEAAMNHSLPNVINYGDVLGDLQVQTNWTDGRDSIEEMAKTALRLRLKYVAITDHTKSLTVAHGNDEKRLLREIKEIERINKELPGIKILKSAEVDILKDGSLDLADEALAQLDVVGVSVHTHFTLPKEEQTKRIVKALSNPYVNIFFHPTARIINRRLPIDFDFEQVLQIARKNKVALEINAYPERLDLRDSLIRQTIQAGVKLVIDTDAHAVADLDYLHFGEGQARRGWATKADILNTQSAEKILKYFRK